MTYTIIGIEKISFQGKDGPVNYNVIYGAAENANICGSKVRELLLPNRVIEDIKSRFNVKNLNQLVGKELDCFTYITPSHKLKIAYVNSLS